MKKSLFSLLFSVILISSCDKSNSVSNSNPIELIPLEVGNTWVSTYSYYDSNGIIKNTVIESLYVSRDSILDDQKYFLLSRQRIQSDGTLNPAFTYLARNSPSGYTERYSSYSGMSYNYPVRIGDSTVVSLNKRVTVPAGSYNCIVYKVIAGVYRPYGDSVYYIYYGKSFISPTIGVIRTELRDPFNNNLKYSSVLNQVILNQK